MAVTLRTASEDDLFFLTEALHKTFLYLAQCGDDPYNQGFSNITIEEMEAYALEYLDERKSRTYILQHDQQDIGCIMGQIAPSHLSAAGIGLVGWIGMCYVEEPFRQRDHCTRMFEAMQAWFASKSVTIIELSYMAANETARAAWRRLGFEPFREIAYKKIGS
jgi:RimJ/RimL family protein N-acetyltransferase